MMLQISIGMAVWFIVGWILTTKVFDAVIKRIVMKKVRDWREISEIHADNVLNEYHSTIDTVSDDPNFRLKTIINAWLWPIMIPLAGYGWHLWLKDWF